MMLESYLRARYQAFFVDPFLGWAKYISPHWLTLAALLLGLGTLPALMIGKTELAVILLLLSGYFDTLDGSVARFTDRSSPQGCVLDIMADRCVEFAVILGLFLQSPATRGLIAILMLGSVLICVTSFLVVGIFDENKGNKAFNYSPGLIERAEAFIFFIAMMLLPAYFTWLGWSFIILVMLTSIIRIWQFFRSSPPPMS